MQRNIQLADRPERARQLADLALDSASPGAGGDDWKGFANPTRGHTGPVHLIRVTIHRSWHRPPQGTQLLPDQHF